MINFPAFNTEKTKKHYVQENHVFLVDLWRRGLSYRGISQEIYKSTGNCIHFTDLRNYLSEYITNEDKIKRFAESVSYSNEDWRERQDQIAESFDPSQLA